MKRKQAFGVIICWLLLLLFTVNAIAKEMTSEERSILFEIRKKIDEVKEHYSKGKQIADSVPPTTKRSTDTDLHRGLPGGGANPKTYECKSIKRSLESGQADLRTSLMRIKGLQPLSEQARGELDKLENMAMYWLNVQLQCR